MIFLAEQLCGVDTGSTYHRKAAGPYDNRALRSIDSQMKKQKWYSVTQLDKRYKYIPMEKTGAKKKYFDRYLAEVGDKFDKVINTFWKFKTERCEIVATLYSAWKDFLDQRENPSDNRIVHEVLNN